MLLPNWSLPLFKLRQIFQKVKLANWHLVLITTFPTLSPCRERQNSFLLENRAYIKSRFGLHTYHSRNCVTMMNHSMDDGGRATHCRRLREAFDKPRGNGKIKPHSKDCQRKPLLQRHPLWIPHEATQSESDSPTPSLPLETWPKANVLH